MQRGQRLESAGQADSGEDLTAKDRCSMCYVIDTFPTAIPDVELRSGFARPATLVDEDFAQSRWLVCRVWKHES